MISLSIRSLRVGTLLLEAGETPVWAWLILGGERTVLVDAGTPEPALVESGWGTRCARGGPEALVEELARHGLCPEDVDLVVATHLHYDHCWNLELFQKAQVWVQRSELAHAIDPVPTHRPWYSRDVTADLVRRARPDRLRIVDGDDEPLPGVRLLHLPGHTPGMMGVVVETSAGCAGLASDVGETYANWHPADARVTAAPAAFLADSFLPPGIATESVATCLASFARLRAASDIVVPGHDPRIPVDLPEMWWDIPADGADPDAQPR